MSDNNARSLCKLLLAGVLSWGVLLGGAATMCYAEEAPTKLGGFSVNPVYPENQITPQEGYFFLEVSPNEQQEVMIIVKNESDTKQTYEIVINDAKTSATGLIVYTDSSTKNDPSLTLPLTSLVSIEETIVTVEANKEKKLKLKLKMPDTHFPGVILGGIHVKPTLKNSKKKENGSLGIDSRYSRVIGLMLTEDKHVRVEKLTDLKLTAVALQIDEHKQVLIASLLNAYPEIVGNVTVTGSIKKKGEKEVILTKNQENIRIAPQSHFPFEMNLTHKFVPGEYIFVATIKGDDKEQLLEREFTIMKPQTRKIEESIKNKLLLPSNLLIGVSVLSLLSLSCLGYVLFRRKENLIK